LSVSSGDDDAVLGVEGDSGAQEGDGGSALLVGSMRGEGGREMIVVRRAELPAAN